MDYENPPLRRRDRQSRLDDGYAPRDLYDEPHRRPRTLPREDLYDDRPPYVDDDLRRYPAESPPPPRRQSEGRSRRHKSPDDVPRSRRDSPPPRTHRSRREAPAPERPRHHPSPPGGAAFYDSEPERQPRRQDDRRRPPPIDLYDQGQPSPGPRSSRGPRDGPRAYSRDPAPDPRALRAPRDGRRAFSRDSSPDAGYARGPIEGRRGTARDYSPGDRPRPRRPGYLPDEPDPRHHRSRRSGPDEALPPSRDLPYHPRPRGAMAAASPRGDHFDDKGRSRRQDLPPGPENWRGRGPPAGRSRDDTSPRGRPPPARGGGRRPQTRPNSMPAPEKPRRSSTNWWQHPLVQAGARTALTAGVQAATGARNEPGDWLGSKGAKIASAALVGGLVDGVIGQKAPNSTRHKAMKEVGNVAVEKAGDVDFSKLRNLGHHRH